MEQEQKNDLMKSFSAAVALSYSKINEENKTNCGCFDIEPFNPHWDRKTVEEVMYNVQLYTRTWIVSPLERAFGLRTEDVSDEMMLIWHQNQVAKLKSKIALKHENNIS